MNNEQQLLKYQRLIVAKGGRFGFMSLPKFVKPKGFEYGNVYFHSY